MNCDHVFEVLTRGPFPRGAADDWLVEDHLSCCESCHRIAEALRPAHDLFHESLAPSEGKRLPVYAGATVSSDGAFAASLSDQPRAGGAPGRSPGSVGGLHAVATHGPAVLPAPAGPIHAAASNGGSRWLSVIGLTGLVFAALALASGCTWPFA